jgi:NADPH:quinone reductase-like Zn-dependent oxidoreductase
MRAIRVQQWGGPEVMKVETNVPIPTPGDNQVRVTPLASVCFLGLLTLPSFH